MTLNIKDLSVVARTFGFGERIPDQHSAEGGNVIVELEIRGVPADAVELAIIVHDPDAPLPFGFTHWVVYGLEPSTTEVGAAHSSHSYRYGPNTLGDHAYMGPQPPPGHGTHHYYFWVYALDATVEGEPNRERFLTNYGDRIIEQNRVVGTFSV